MVLAKDPADDGGLANPSAGALQKKVPSMRLSIRLAFVLTPLVFALALLAPTRAAEKEGWISLYNGKDLTGWSYSETDTFGGKTEASDGRYTAKGEAIVVNPHDPARGPKLRQMWTTRKFPKNFILKLEFRAAVNADSGVFIRKPQLQCRDYLVAGPYTMLKKYKPQKWNKLVITVKDNVAHCECNGEVLEDRLMLPETGPIGLEADRDQMEYRRIRLKELE